MTSTRPSAEAQGYLESLMHAGQDAMKQFDHALVSAAGVGTKGSSLVERTFLSLYVVCRSPARILQAAVAVLERGFLQNFAGGAHSDVAIARGDKRFKDEVWQEMPYYDLLKQSYLLGSRQLHEFVDQAQVDDKTKLQLRFYARQFIDAMSPSNFPATNPEVIRKAIETRSVSLTDGMQNLIDDLQKGRITRVDEFGL